MILYFLGGKKDKPSDTITKYNENIQTRYSSFLVHRDLRHAGMLYLKAGFPSNYHNLPPLAKHYIHFFHYVKNVNTCNRLKDLKLIFKN